MPDHPSAAPPPLTPLFIVIPGAVLLDERLCDKAKLLYGVLAWLADDRGHVWLSPARVMSTLNLEMRRTRMLFAELRAAGHIALEKPAVKGERPNVWRLTSLPRRQKIAAVQGQETASLPGKKLLTEEDKTEKTSSPSRPFSPEVEESIAGYLRSAAFPESVRGAIRAATAGLSIHPPATDREVIQAIEEMMAGNVVRFSVRVFRGFLRSVRAGDPTPRPAGATFASTPGREGMAQGLRRLRGEGGSA